MRMRHTKVTAVSLGVAVASMVGGALVTSSASAASAPDDTATVTVMSIQAGDTQPVTCTYDNILGPGASIVWPRPVAGTTDGPPSGRATVSGGDGADVWVQAVPVAPGSMESRVARVSGGAGDGLPRVHDGMFAISTVDARPGTPEECEALRPTSAAGAAAAGRARQ